MNKSKFNLKKHINTVKLENKLFACPVIKEYINWQSKTNSKEKEAIQ